MKSMCLTLRFELRPALNFDCFLLRYLNWLKKLSKTLASGWQIILWAELNDEDEVNEDDDETNEDEKDEEDEEDEDDEYEVLLFCFKL